MDAVLTPASVFFFVRPLWQGFGGMGKPFQRRYVVSQAVQIMETAVVNNAAALSAFRDLGAAEVRRSLGVFVGRLVLPSSIGSFLFNMLSTFSC